MGEGGTFDFDNGNASVTVAAGSSVNLSQGSIVNAGNASLTFLGSDAFVILPSGFDPASELANFTNEGTTYIAGTTLDVLAGRTLRLSGEFFDPVRVGGVLLAASGTSLSLGEGLAIESSGSVNLGNEGSVTYKSGSYVMSGGSLTTANMTVASVGPVQFSQSGGEVRVNSGFRSALFIGSSTNATGTYDHTGGSLEVGEMNIGSNFPGYWNGMAGASLNGTYSIEGNATLNVGQLLIGGMPGWKGTMNVTGGTTSIFESQVGTGGLLNILGGLVSTQTRMINVGSGGKVLLSGGTLSTTNTYLTADISGEFEQTGGDHQSGAINIVGSYSLTGGTMAVDDFYDYGMSLTGSFVLGGNATFSTVKLTQNGGTFHQQGSAASIGALALNSGTYQMSGGSLSINSSWTMGEGGTFDFDNGNASVTVAAGSVLNLRQGTIANAQNSTLSVLGSDSLVVFPRHFKPWLVFGNFTNEGTTYTVGSTLIVQNGKRINLAGTIADAIDTAGEINLTENLETSSDITLRESGKIVGAGKLKVVGGTVRGRGEIATDLLVEAGAISPGLSPGVSTISGNMVLNNGTALVFEIGGRNAGSEYDVLQHIGDSPVEISAATLNATLTGNFTPVKSDTFQIFTSTAGIAGSFGNLSGGRLDIGQGSFLVSNYGGTITLSDYTPYFAPGEDGDSDNLPDAWEWEFFGSMERTATQDSDGDGTSDRTEYVAGTNPTDPSSKFSARPVHGASGLKIEFPTKTGRSYKVWGSPNLTDWTLQETIQGSEAMVEWQPDFGQSPPAKFFLRIEVIQNPN